MTKPQYEGVRELAGVASLPNSQAVGSSGYLLAEECGATVQVTASAAGVRLTPDEARSFAADLQRLAHRISSRKGRELKAAPAPVIDPPGIR